jgi:Zn-dependent membrane protease YugP
VQHRDGDPLLMTRTRWAGALDGVNKIAFGLLLSIPLLAIILKSPTVAAIQALAIVALIGARVLVHALTLPVEIDASFKRALPALERGGYLTPQDLPAARSVLKAAALTYVAGALATLIDIARVWR